MVSSRFRVVAATAGITGMLLAGISVSTVRVAEGAGGEPGGGTHNGLKPKTYHATKAGALDAFLSSPEGTVNSPWALHLTAYTLTLDQDQATTLVTDTIGCALGQRQVWDGFHGEGLLTPGKAAAAPPFAHIPTARYWPGPDPGNTWRKEDIHTCLIARMNLAGERVPIFLSGAHVTPRAANGYDDIRDYPYREAVWLVSIDNPSGGEMDPPGRSRVPSIHVHVWPFADTLRLHCRTPCGPDFDPRPLARRVCGSLNPQSCGLIVHEPPNVSPLCKEESTPSNDGVWWCSAHEGETPKPAIQTRLGPCAWRLLYGNSCADVWSDPAQPQPPSRYLQNTEAYCNNPDNP